MHADLIIVFYQLTLFQYAYKTTFLWSRRQATTILLGTCLNHRVIFISSPILIFLMFRHNKLICCLLLIAIESVDVGVDMKNWSVMKTRLISLRISHADHWLITRIRVYILMIMSIRNGCIIMCQTTTKYHKIMDRSETVSKRECRTKCGPRKFIGLKSSVVSPVFFHALAFHWSTEGQSTGEQ